MAALGRLQRARYGMVLRLALILVAASSAASERILPVVHSSGAEDRARVITAQILSAAGSPYGGRFAVLGRQTRDLLAFGSVDCWGELECVVNVPEGDSQVVLLVQSRGMLGNSYEEWRNGHGALPNAPQEALIFDARGGMPDSMLTYIWSDALPDCKAGILATLIREGEEHRTTHFNQGVHRKEVLDSVATVLTVGERKSIGVGSIKFLSVHAALEVQLDLQDEEGAAVAERVVLGGFVGFPERPDGNPVYPHMALAQRGSEVRILLNRASARLLYSNPEEFLVLRSVQSREFQSLIVPLPARVRSEISACPGSLRFDAVVRDEVQRDGDIFRGRPLQPELWWLLEPRLRW